MHTCSIDSMRAVVRARDHKRGMVASNAAAAAQQSMKTPALTSVGQVESVAPTPVTCAVETAARDSKGIAAISKLFLVRCLFPAHRQGTGISSLPLLPLQHTAVVIARPR
jgi:hypothetical protein